LSVLCTIWYRIIRMAPFLAIIVVPVAVGEIAAFAIELWLWPWRAAHGSDHLVLREFMSLGGCGGFLLSVPLIVISEKVWRRFVQTWWRRERQRSDARLRRGVS
jgi:hypothetical protein